MKGMRLIRVEVSDNKGHRVEFETDDPEEAFRRVVLFIKKFHPEVYEKWKTSRRNYPMRKHA